MKDDDGRCYTECDRYGCYCRMVSNETALESVDHVILSLVDETPFAGSQAAGGSASNTLCLCGNVQVRRVVRRRVDATPRFRVVYGAQKKTEKEIDRITKAAGAESHEKWIMMH